MWEVTYTRRFLKEMVKLPKEIQTRAEKIVFEELFSANPSDLGRVIPGATSYGRQIPLLV